MQGPLSGIRVIEFAGIGPGPFAAMLLSDMGADVLRVQRPDVGATEPVTARGRRQVVADLKTDEGRTLCKRLAGAADVLVEGFRPGVMERLGLGPDALLEDNPGLVYARMTGWGQTGPYADRAGHDIDYIAIAGALGMFGPADAPPVPPLNLVGDFGGGALYLVMGVCAALVERSRSGQGQVIDCAMTDGAASLTAIFHGLRAGGRWGGARGRNLLDGGAPFYRCYACADGRHVAVGPLEPAFFDAFAERLGIAGDPLAARRFDPAAWPQLEALIAARFAERGRDEWAGVFEGSDACVAPVLAMDEAPADPHNRARETFVTADGVTQPNVAPRFSRTPGAIAGPAPGLNQHDEDAIADWLG